MSRYHRLNGDEVLFSTGTDEHGIKIQKRALEEKKDPQQFCDHYSSSFRQLFQKAHISYDRFIRTTDQEHKVAVEAFWKKLMSQNTIQQGSHEGYYSVNEETFFAEKDLIKDDSQAPPIFKTETGEKVELL